MAPIDGDGTRSHTTPPLTDIRTFGPILMIVFGFVLAFTPMASVGITGSVGNAGFAGKVAPETTTTLPPTTTTLPPATTTTMPPTTTTLPPTTTTMPATTTTTMPQTTTTMPPGTTTLPPATTQPPATTVAPTTTDGAGASPVAPAPQLPATGAVEANWGWMVGVAFIVLGAVMLVSGRRPRRIT